MSELKRTEIAVETRRSERGRPKMKDEDKRPVEQRINFGKKDLEKMYTQVENVSNIVNELYLLKKQKLEQKCREAQPDIISFKDDDSESSEEEIIVKKAPPKNKKQKVIYIQEDSSSSAPSEISTTSESSVEPVKKKTKTKSKKPIAPKSAKSIAKKKKIVKDFVEPRRGRANKKENSDSSSEEEQVNYLNSANTMRFMPQSRFLNLM